MRTTITSGFDDQSDHDGQGNASAAAGLASETLRLEHLLKLDRVEPKTQLLFTALRRDLPPEHYEALLADLVDLAGVWLAAHYRYTRSLPDEFARAWRRDESQRIPSFSRTVRDLRQELVNRGSSHLREKLSSRLPKR